MSRFFFFTDSDLLLNQLAGEAFGPVAISDPDYESGKVKYRLSSMHSASSNPLAYAICKGQVLVQQDDSNPDLVNIVLKPFEQPNTDLPVIKFYIYRGILKQSLTDNTNIIPGGNTLTYDILDNNNSTPHKVLGLELTGTNYSDSDFIENAFTLPKSDFELWTVLGGWSIGEFDKDSFGLEIVFEQLGAEPLFSSIRKRVNLLEISELSGTPNDIEIFDFKNQKEAILNYLDPCAFFGSFYSDKLFVRKSIDNTDTEFNHEFSKKTGDELYEEIFLGGNLTSPTGIYQNKNTIYLDIRNNNNFSLNYFENFGDNIKLSYNLDDDEPTDIVDYYNNGWPILKLDDISANNNESTVHISFPVLSSTTPLICVLSGSQQLSLREKIKNGKSSFKQLSRDLEEPYTTNSLVLNIFNYDESTSVCQYLKLKYIDKNDLQAPAEASAFSPIKSNILDFIFRPSMFSMPIQSSTGVSINVIEEDIYLNLLNEYGKDFTTKLGIAKDFNNTILFCALAKRNTKSRFKAQAPSYSITKSIKSTTNYFSSYISEESVNQLSDTNIQIGTDIIQLIRVSDPSWNYFFKRNAISFKDEFFSIILSNSDFESVINLANTNFGSFYSPFICIGNEVEGLDDNGIKYIKSEVILKGLNENVSTNQLEMKEIATEIFLYTYPKE